MIREQPSSERPPVIIAYWAWSSSATSASASTFSAPLLEHESVSEWLPSEMDELSPLVAAVPKHEVRKGLLPVLLTLPADAAVAVTSIRLAELLRTADEDDMAD